MVTPVGSDKSLSYPDPSSPFVGILPHLWDGAVGNLRVSSVILRDEIKEVVELWREGLEENHMLKRNGYILKPRNTLTLEHLS
jgi:hypothetical protein